MKVKFDLPHGLEPLFEDIRYKVLYGGRGSAKSHSVAQMHAYRAVKSPRRILCTRELQKSIKESVHELIEQKIWAMGLQDYYQINVNSITTRDGVFPEGAQSRFVFEGLKGNVREIKSMEGIDDVWVEEAEAVSDFSWRTLIPTIRKPGSEIWVTFNPFEEMDPTYLRFITPHLYTLLKHGVYRDERRFIRHMNYPDNPWFPGSALEQEMLEDKANNYRLYLHVWEGQPLGDYGDAIIKPEWFEAAVDSHTKLGIKPRGLKVLGFDPADEGEDEKAMVIRHGPVVQHLSSWRNGDVEDASIAAATRAIDAQCTDLVFDAIGVGTGAKVTLRKELAGRQVRLTPFVGSASPADPDSEYRSVMDDDSEEKARDRDYRTNADVFLNRRAQGYKELADRFELTFRAVVKKQYVDPDRLISISSRNEQLTQLKSELIRIQRKRSRSNNSRFQVESKTDMRARDMPSPNLADALMYAFQNDPPEPDRTRWAGINDRLHGRR